MYKFNSFIWDDRKIITVSSYYISIATIDEQSSNNSNVTTVIMSVYSQCNHLLSSIPSELDLQLLTFLTASAFPYFIFYVKFWSTFQDEIWSLGGTSLGMFSSSHASGTGS